MITGQTGSKEKFRKRESEGEGTRVKREYTRRIPF